jgi:hypothetical protein
MKTLNIFVLAVLAGAVIVTAVNYKKIKQKISSGKKGNKPEKGAEGIKPEINYSTVPELEISTDEEKAAKELNAELDSFTGLYESLHVVVNGSSDKLFEVVKEWDTRVRFMKNRPFLNKKWDSLFEGFSEMEPAEVKEKARLFLYFVFAAGIKRDGRHSITVNNETRFRYYTLNGEEFINGKNAEVAIPCWHFNNKVIEKGIIKY